jgi:hypothetical protein
LARYEGVVGVLLVGGVARGHADRFSELDLAVYLRQADFARWTVEGAAPFPEGDSNIDGQHVDLEYCCYEEEREREWDLSKRWDRSYALLLYDPHDLMEGMLAQKCRLTEAEKQCLATKHLITYGDYFCRIAVPSWLYRGDVLAAHHCLNLALDSLVKAVFLANDELVPFEKWALNFSYSLAWRPPKWREKVEQALLVREVTQEEVERRRALLCDLFAQCKERLGLAGAEGLDAIEVRKLKMLRYVRERRTMPAKEFDERFGLRQAIQSPLFQVLGRETRSGEAWFVFDEARFAEYAQRDFSGFLDWDRQLLRQLMQPGASRPTGMDAEP